MPHYDDEKVLPYTPEQLFNIVLDIDSYQEFLPWCRRSEVLDHLPDQKKLYASVTAGYLIYSEMYVSKVTYEKSSFINAEYIDGPFKNLYTNWKFSPHPHGCKLQFIVEFEFSQSLLNTIAEHVLDQISRHMVDAFINRARVLYGDPKH